MASRRLTRGRFSKVPVTFWARNMFCVSCICIYHQIFNDFGKWARNCASIQPDLLLKFAFGPETFRGHSRNGPLACTSSLPADIAYLLPDRRSKDNGKGIRARPFLPDFWTPQCNTGHLQKGHMPALHSRSLFENIQLEFMIVYRFLFTVFIVFGICFWDIKKMYSLSFLNLWGNGMSNCIYNHINPFAPEPPVTARADPRPSCRFWRHQF